MIDIGDRLELFVDRHLIGRTRGVELRLNRPVRREVVLVHDTPWEGNATGYHTVFKDGRRYRMFYRGWNHRTRTQKWRETRTETICYAESDDGVHWRRPELGLIAFDGSTKNNIIWTGPGSHNFTPFKDTNPACKPAVRYKALGGGADGLLAFGSRDGIHWKRLSDKPVITRGAFDSQNLAFWDSRRGCYVDYHREFRNGRDVMTCTSPDFLNWTKPVFLKYRPGRLTELYTNQILPYYRAPHILLGFPARYVAGREQLTDLNRRLSQLSERFGTDYTDTGLMASRDGRTFDVWGEAFLRPGPMEEGRWVYGDNYQNWGLVETASAVAGSPDELSVYATENCWRDGGMRLRRYTLRIDGFASAHAPLAGGELVTKPLIFKGKRLLLNLATSAAGAVRVEIQTARGKPVPGFSLADCTDAFGDSLAHPMRWGRRNSLASLSGKTVRLRFALSDADLYAFRVSKE